MAFRNIITLKSCFSPTCCFKAKNPLLSEPKLAASKHSSFRGLSMSDLSNSSLSVMSDLSISLVGSNLHVFTLKELKDITQNLSKSNFLGEGGFGPVYKGFIDDKLRPGLEAQPVAVKVLDLDGKQGHREWLVLCFEPGPKAIPVVCRRLQAEVIYLGQLRHSHLVTLIGYCCEDEHRLLVYEYMERGNLDNQLFRGYSAALPWLTRIKIAIGAAKGLSFLHEEEKPVIFRDFKASNILLDSDYNAKLSDFGLATDGPEGDETHVTTRVMGTEGYAAPEYIMTGHLTTMSDVFSYGVVLLELLTGRRSVDKNRPGREQNLVDWARPLLKDTHKLERIIDRRLEGQYSSEGARKVALLAYQCLSQHPKSRPTMSHVVKTLEPLLDLKDIPIGPFVYTVPNEENSESECSMARKSRDHGNGNKDEKKEEEEKKKGRQQQGKGHRYNRRRIKKSLRSRAVYSDTALYKTLGTSLYSSVLEPLGQEGIVSSNP